jgi:uncharacterized protein
MEKPGTALITGASSGIGKSFAQRLASDGFSLVLHGRRENLLKALCNDIRSKYGVDAAYVVAELSNSHDLHRLEEHVKTIPDLMLLVNNAGFGTARTFENEDVALHDAMIQTHITAPVRLAYAALPQMLERGHGAIINVSSVAGFLVSPGSLYCATKAALTNFSESLDLQVRSRGVRVQALCPGFTRSDFHQRIGVDVSGDFFRHFMTAEEVVDASMKALKRGKVVCIPGLSYKLAAAAPRYLPRGVMYGLSSFYRRMRGQKRGT